jgi:hypothetical protein
MHQKYQNNTERGEYSLKIHLQKSWLLRTLQCPVIHDLNLRQNAYRTALIMHSNYLARKLGPLAQWLRRKIKIRVQVTFLS